MSMFDRLSAGPGNLQPQDHQEWNQAVGSVPPDRFQQAATQAVQQVDPQQYYQHTQPGVGGTDPFGSLAPQLRGGLAQSLLSALTGQGANQQQIGQVLGTGGQAGYQNIDPRQLSPQQLAALAQYAQRNNPQALGQVAQQYQTQPDVLHSLLGNKALLAVVAGLGATYLANRQR